MFLHPENFQVIFQKKEAKIDKSKTLQESTIESETLENFRFYG